MRGFFAAAALEGFGHDLYLFFICSGLLDYGGPRRSAILAVIPCRLWHTSLKRLRVPWIASAEPGTLKSILRQAGSSRAAATNLPPADHGPTWMTGTSPVMTAGPRVSLQ